MTPDGTARRRIQATSMLVVLCLVAAPPLWHQEQELAAAAAAEQDDVQRLDEARVLAQHRDFRGLKLALGFLESDAPLLFREEAHQLLVDAAGRDLGYDPTAPAAANRAALERWREWVDR